MVSASYDPTNGQAGESCATYVKDTCDGKASCSLQFTNVNCGRDPDPGIPKRGNAVVQCGSYCNAAGQCSYPNAKEGVAATLSCPTNTGAILVTAATFDVDGHSESCASYVADRCDAARSCAVTMTDTVCGGDPDPGVVKAGAIGYGLRQRTWLASHLVSAQISAARSPGLCAERGARGGHRQKMS